MKLTVFGITHEITGGVVIRFNNGPVTACLSLYCGTNGARVSSGNLFFIQPHQVRSCDGITTRYNLNLGVRNRLRGAYGA